MGSSPQLSDCRPTDSSNGFSGTLIRSPSVPVEVIENVRLQSKARDGAYCGTVFSPVDGKAIPLLITFGARTEEASQRIWMDIQNELSNLDTAHIFNVAQMMNHRPRAPFVADFLFFKYCIGYWMVEKILLCLNQIVSGVNGKVVETWFFAFIISAGVHMLVLLPDGFGRVFHGKSCCVGRQ